MRNENAASGLVLMGHRWYDASLGRFLTRDPIGFAGGLNLYEYAASNPANRVDPYGMDSSTALKLGLGLSLADGPLPYGDMLAFALITGGVLLAASNCNNQRDWDPMDPFEDWVFDQVQQEVQRQVNLNVFGNDDSNGPSQYKHAAAPGRGGKQARLLALMTDPKVAAYLRGWIKQEVNAIRCGKRKTIRLPFNGRKVPQGQPPWVLAHRRKFEAKKGYGYEHSDLQNNDLHKLQHKHEGY